MTTLVINAPWHQLHGTYTFFDRNDKTIFKYMEQVAKDKKALVGNKLPKQVVEAYERCGNTYMYWANRERYHQERKENIAKNEVIQAFRAKTLPYSVSITITHTND